MQSHQSNMLGQPPAFRSFPASFYWHRDGIGKVKFTESRQKKSDAQPFMVAQLPATSGPRFWPGPHRVGEAPVEVHYKF